VYFFRVRCRDLGNHMLCNMGKGVAKFNDPSLTSFIGEGDMGCIPDDVVFLGRKVVSGDGSTEAGSGEDEEDDSAAETDYDWNMFAGVQPAGISFFE